MLSRAFFALAIAATSAVALAWSGRLGSPNEALAAGETVVLQGRDRLGEFRLRNDRSESFTETQLDGHWSVLLFGYTHCPDVCPTTLQVLAPLARELRPDEQVLFVTVDPARDGPVALERYLAPYTPSIVGLTGDDIVVRRLAEQVGAWAPGLAWPAEHATSLFVVDPGRRPVAVLLRPVSPARLRRDLDRVRDRP